MEKYTYYDLYLGIIRKSTDIDLDDVMVERR
jgi:hypothetical protein